MTATPSLVNPTSNSIKSLFFIASLKADLETVLARENSSAEFVITSDADSLIISGKVLPYKQGKDSGEPVDFDVEVTVRATDGSKYDADLTLVENTVAHSGQGTGKQIAIMEYFFRGYETTDYGREVGFPNDFTQTYGASTAKTYNTVVIEYFHDRTRVNIERSPKVLFLAVEYTNLASNSNTNDLLAEIRTATGLTTGQLPDLAVV